MKKTTKSRSNKPTFPPSASASSSASTGKLVPIKELIEKADELRTKFEFDKAKEIYIRALKREPNNTTLLDGYADLLINMELVEEAIPVLQQSIRVSPASGPLKYLNLAQLTEGQESLSLYQKAIQILLDQRTSLLPATTTTTTTTSTDSSPFVFQAVSEELEKKLTETNHQLSTAFCSVAELYMTDLCMEAEAERNCGLALDKALEFDPKNPEVYQTKASYLISTHNPSLAKQLLLESIQMWINLDVLERPSHDVRIGACKLLLELNETEQAIQILQMLLEENDENDEIWYLLCLAAHQSKQFRLAVESCTSCLQLLQKMGCPRNDPYFQEIAQMLAESQEQVKDLPEEEEGEEWNEDDEANDENIEEEDGDEDEWEDVEDEDMAE